MVLAARGLCHGCWRKLLIGCAVALAVCAGIAAASGQQLPPPGSTLWDLPAPAPALERLPPVDDVEVPAETAPASPASDPLLQFGYDNGFFMASPDDIELQNEDEIPFLLRINARVQMRHTNFSSDGPTPNENDFELERAFLIFTGFAYTPDLAYHIKFDGDSDELEGVDLFDLFVTYDIGHHQWCWEAGALSIRAGKWKMPFHRARWENGFALQFSDRAMASDFFDINRSIGLGPLGKFNLGQKSIYFETAVFNGFLTQRFRPARAGELDRNFGFAGRIYSDLIGEWGLDGEPELSFHLTPAVRAGCAVATTRLSRTDGLREFAGPPGLRVVDSGAPLATVLPPAVTAFDVALFSADINFKYRGFSFHSEAYFRRLTDFAGASVPDLADQGFLLQAGCFVIPEKLELISRWSRVWGNSGTLGIRDESADEVAGGIAWYIRGQDLKLVCDVTHLNGAPINSPTLNILPGDIGWLVRSQFQFMF